jgi:hypothetical protein
MIKKTPFALIAGAVIGLAALLALPWVGKTQTSITLLEIAKLKAHGHQVAYVIFGALALAVIIGVVSISRSRRWLTAPAAVALLIPTVLSAVAKNAALGARIATVASAIALVSAIVLTIKPVRSDVRMS